MFRRYWGFLFIRTYGPLRGVVRTEKRRDDRNFISRLGDGKRRRKTGSS